MYANCCDDDPTYPDRLWNSLSAQQKSLYYRQADAALAAMRVPLMELIEAQIPLWEETDPPRHALSVLWGKVRDLTGAG
jgi:hypothetical protein